MLEAIRIELNGRERELPRETSVAALLRDLGMDDRTVVVEVNRRIVRRPELDGKTLESGDRVELVHFVGGG